MPRRGICVPHSKAKTEIDPPSGTAGCARIRRLSRYGRAHDASNGTARPNPQGAVHPVHTYYDSFYSPEAAAAAERYLSASKSGLPYAPQRAISLRGRLVASEAL